MTDSRATRVSGDLATVAVVLNRDLLFGSRIRGAVGLLGMNAVVKPDTASFVEALQTSGASVAIGIIDMNGPVDWERLAAALGEAEGVPPTLAFGPHTDVENRRRAKAAGISRIVSNGQFQQEAVELIDRYRRA